MSTAEFPDSVSFILEFSRLLQAYIRFVKNLPISFFYCGPCGTCDVFRCQVIWTPRNLYRSRNLSYICNRAHAIIILEDFHGRTFKVFALVLSASQCLKFLWDLERSLKDLLISSQVLWIRTEKKRVMLLRLLTIKQVTVLTLWQTPITLKLRYIWSNNWVNRWIKKWNVLQITGQKQRFDEISFHILISILVLYHAYGTFTNIRNLHHASYDFRLCKSWLLTNVVHGSSTATLPWAMLTLWQTPVSLNLPLIFIFFIKKLSK